MSQSKQYGLGSLIPGPDFKISIDKEGKSTGSQTFRIGKDGAVTILQTLLRKGQAANVLDPRLGTQFDFLVVDTIDAQETPGGITEFYITYVGKSWFAEFDNDSESTYSLTAGTMERSILEHPVVRQLVNIWALTQLYDGSAVVGNPIEAKTLGNQVRVVSTGDYGTLMGYITDADSLKWYDKIFNKGIRTYEAPSLEWTWNGSNIGGLPSTAIANMGYIDDPRGNPPTPDGCNWRMTGATDSRTRGGGKSTSSFSISWTCSPFGKPWDVDIYTKP